MLNTFTPSGPYAPCPQAPRHRPHLRTLTSRAHTLRYPDVPLPLCHPSIPPAAPRHPRPALTRSASEERLLGVDEGDLGLEDYEQPGGGIQHPGSASSGGSGGSGGRRPHSTTSSQGGERQPAGGNLSGANAEAFGAYVKALKE